VHDVVVGALELAAQRALEGLHLGREIRVVRRHAKEAAVALALDVRLIAVADDEQIDGVPGGERAHDVAQLDAGACGSGDRTEAGDQDARHDDHARAPRAPHQGPSHRVDRGVEPRIAGLNSRSRWSTSARR